MYCKEGCVVNNASYLVPVYTQRMKQTANIEHCRHTAVTGAIGIAIVIRTHDGTKNIYTAIFTHHIRS